MSKPKIYDLTNQVRAAWEHFDKLLDEKIQRIHELTGVEKERLVKLNPAEFIRDQHDNVIIEGYHYQKLGDWVAKIKTPESYDQRNQLCACL